MNRNKTYTITLKEVVNYLALSQPVRRLMISDEMYVQRFWHAVGIKELDGAIAVRDHQHNAVVSVSCHSFHHKKRRLQSLQ